MKPLFVASHQFREPLGELLGALVFAWLRSSVQLREFFQEWPFTPRVLLGCSQASKWSFLIRERSWLFKLVIACLPLLMLFERHLAVCRASLCPCHAHQKFCFIVVFFFFLFLFSALPCLLASSHTPLFRSFVMALFDLLCWQSPFLVSLACLCFSTHRDILVLIEGTSSSPPPAREGLGDSSSPEKGAPESASCLSQPAFSGCPSRQKDHVGAKCDILHPSERGHIPLASLLALV